MILLHPKVGLGDQMVVQFGVVFANDRVESDLRVFGHAHVPELAIVGTLRTGDELLDRQSDTSDVLRFWRAATASTWSRRSLGIRTVQCFWYPSPAP